jgi:hypothetical protein
MDRRPRRTRRLLIGIRVKRHPAGHCGGRHVIVTIVDCDWTRAWSSAKWATSPQVDTERCNKSFIRRDRGAHEYWYAEHQYPGKTQADLINVMVVWAEMNTSTRPPGYRDMVLEPSGIQDGKVTFDCGADGKDVSVKFILR